MTPKSPEGDFAECEKSKIMDKIKLYILLAISILLIGCNRTQYTEKERALLRIASLYIEQKRAEFRRIDSFSELPVRIEVIQNADYRGYYQFTISFTISSMLFESARMPTKVTRVRNRYVFMYMRDKPPLSREDLPNEVFNENAGGMWHSMDWEALMCKQCFRSIVSIWLVCSFNYIKQMNDFVCDCKNKGSGKPEIILIEIADAIIDTPDGNCPPPPPPPIIN